MLVTALVLALAPAAGPGPSAAGPPAAADEPGVAAEARSVPVESALTVRPGRTCLDASRLAEQIVTWLGREEVDERLTIEVVGSPDDDRSAVFTLRDRGERIAERPFEHLPRRCEDAHTAVGLAIALAIDATLLEAIGVGEPEPQPKPAPGPVPAPVPEPVSEPPPSPASTPVATPPPRPRIPIEAWTHVRGLLTIGAPPGLGGGGQLGGEVTFRGIVDLRGSVLAATSGRQTIDAEDGTSLTASIVAGRLDVCAGPWLGRVRPRGCVGPVAGGAIASGRGFRVDRTISLPWVAVALGADLRVRLTRRLALEFGLDGLVTAVSPGLDIENIDGPQPVRDFARFAVGIGAGLAIQLR